MTLAYRDAKLSFLTYHQHALWKIIRALEIQHKWRKSAVREISFLLDECTSGIMRAPAGGTYKGGPGKKKREKLIEGKWDGGDSGK